MEEEKRKEKMKEKRNDKENVSLAYVWKQGGEGKRKKEKEKCLFGLHLQKQRNEKKKMCYLL